jgi:hypothetical protein
MASAQDQLAAAHLDELQRLAPILDHLVAPSITADQPPASTAG